MFVAKVVQATNRSRERPRTAVMMGGLVSGSHSVHPTGSYSLSLDADAANRSMDSHTRKTSVNMARRSATGLAFRTSRTAFSGI
jgi:hypothetical protein